MTNGKHLTALLAAMLLTACGLEQLDIVSAPTKARMVRSVPDARLLGWSGTPVRTYLKEGEKRGAEIAGAVCQIRARDFRATVTTPAIVELPVYVQGARFAERGKPGPIDITCRVDGKSGRATIEAMASGAQNMSYHSPGYTTNGTYAGGTTTTVFYGQLASSYPWRYSAMGVVVE